MGKPWARYEIDFIEHPKFELLSANAICLWLEAKNYCDKHHTDGLIPAIVVKRFRFYGKKSMNQLLASRGEKYPGVPYAPLLESHVLGWKMHDFLDHNECREIAIARISRAEEERGRERKRKADARAAKTRNAAGQTSGQLPDKSPDTGRMSGWTSGETSGPCPPNVRLYTESEVETKKERTEEISPPPRSGKQPPLQLGLQRFKVFRWMLEDCLAALGAHADAFDLDAFLRDLDTRETRVIPEVWPWLRMEVLAEARRRGLPIAGVVTTESLEANTAAVEAILRRRGAYDQ